MQLSSHASVADSFSSIDESEETDFTLRDGARIAVIGGGPAGSFFSYFLLKMTDAIDLDIEVDIYEPRSFSQCGPAGCNHCGGIVSELLVQILAAEGINLPPSVVQRGVESYVVHMDVGDVEIESPAHEQRIAALYRGNGPREGGDVLLDSFDGYLQGMAVDRGARVVRKLITDVEWRDGRPCLQSADGECSQYDLVSVASGVNSNFIKMLDDHPAGFVPPRTTRGYICEFRSTEKEIRRILGSSVHVFLLWIPRFEFAAIIPKGPFATVVMVGDNLDQELVHAFLQDPVVRKCFPTDVIPCVCSCSPLINLGARKRPYGDRKGNWLIPDADGAVGHGVLAGGDVLELGIAGNAIMQGRQAAEQVHFQLQGIEDDAPIPDSRPGIGPDQVKFDSKPGSEAVRTPKLPGDERITRGSAEVASTITEEQFLAEAKRCFSCGYCFGCEQCSMFCTSGCFTKLEEVMPGMYFTLLLDECKECGKCIEVCPCGYLEATPHV